MAERDVPLTAHDFPHRVLDLFDAYVHDGLPRRGFFDRCAAQVGTTSTASGLLAALSPDFVKQVGPATDKRISVSKVDIASTKGAASI